MTGKLCAFVPVGLKQGCAGWLDGVFVLPAQGRGEVPCSRAATDGKGHSQIVSDQPCPHGFPVSIACGQDDKPRGKGSDCQLKLGSCE